MHLKRLAALVAAVCTLWALPMSVLAAQTPGGLDIDQTGDLVDGSYVYRSSVTLTLLPEHPQDTLLIEDGGVWMELTPDKEQNYTLTFRQPREYKLRFVLRRRTARAANLVRKALQSILCLRS